MRFVIIVPVLIFLVYNANFIIFSEYSENFEIKYEASRWYINIIKILDDNILLKNTELIITLTASKGSDTAQAALIMNLPQHSSQEAPEFSMAYYLAEYPKEGSGTIEFENPIEFTNIKDPESITINLDSKYCDTRQNKYTLPI